MLTEQETDRVWTKMLEAEARSYYFGELASRYSRRKQIITGLSFFFSSAAAATIASNTNRWLPIMMSIAVALITAYSIAISLDRRVLTMAKLHGQWNQIAGDLEHLWHHWYEDQAEEIRDSLLRRAGEASEIATTEAPYDRKLWDKWQKHVNSLRAPV